MSKALVSGWVRSITLYKLAIFDSLKLRLLHVCRQTKFRIALSFWFERILFLNPGKKREGVQKNDWRWFSRERRNISTWRSSFGEYSLETNLTEPIKFFDSRISESFFYPYNLFLFGIKNLERNVYASEFVCLVFSTRLIILEAYIIALLGCTTIRYCWARWTRC